MRTPLLAVGGIVVVLLLSLYFLQEDPLREAPTIDNIRATVPPSGTAPQPIHETAEGTKVVDPPETNSQANRESLPEPEGPQPRNAIESKLYEHFEWMESVDPSKVPILVQGTRSLLSRWRVNPLPTEEQIEAMDRSIKPIQNDLLELKRMIRTAAPQAYRRAVTAGQYETLPVFPAPGQSRDDLKKAQFTLLKKIRTSRDIPLQDYLVFSHARPNDNWHAFVYLTRETNPESLKLNDKKLGLEKQRESILRAKLRELSTNGQQK